MGTPHIQDSDPVLVQVRALCARLENPHWMDAPKAWIWARPDGRPQGFGSIAGDEPGLANLLWLSLDLGSPPQCYDSQRNILYGLLLTYGPMALLEGAPLLDLASVLTLRQFHRLLPVATPVTTNGAERTYPLLRLLAERRLLCMP